MMHLRGCDDWCIHDLYVRKILRFVKGKSDCTFWHRFLNFHSVPFRADSYTLVVIVSNNNTAETKVLSSLTF